MNNKSTFFGCKGIFFLCAIALAVVGLAFVGCSDPTGGGSFSEPAYSGKFTMSGPVTGSDTVVFELDSIPARAAASSTGLSGKLKDKSGVYRLSGTYAPESGAVKLSANGASFRYIISGAFDDTGAVVAHSALVLNKANATSAVFEVVEHSGGPIGGDAQAGRDDDDDNVIPEQFVGTWLFRDEEFQAHNDWDGVTTMAITFSPYTFYVFYTDDGHKDGFGRVERRKEYGGLLVEISPRITDAAYPNGYYDAIFVLPGYNDELTPAGRAPVNALFEDYLESKGISVPERVTPDFDNGPDWNAWAADTTTKQYYISHDGSVFCHNFPVGAVGDDWLVILSHWRSVNSTSQYKKLRFWIDGFGKLQMGVYGEFDSLTDAQNANGDWEATGQEFTRQ